LVLLFTRGGGAAGEEEEEEEVVDDDDDEEEEENATVRTDVLLLPRQEGDVLEDVDADVVVDAYEVDALLAAQTNARLLVHARILCCVVMHGRLSSFVSVVGLMKNLYFFTNRKRRDKSASSHSLAEIKIERNKKSAKRNTHTHTNMFSLSASSFVGTSVSASFKGTRDAFVAKGARECFSERGDFYFLF